MKLDLGGPEALGLGADGVGRVGGDVVGLRLDRGFHLVKRPPRVLVFVILVREEDVGEVDLAARDVDRLTSVDEGFVEPLGFVVVGRADDGGPLAHQRSMADRRETMSVDSRPPLPFLRQSKKSRMRTLL